MEQLLYVSQSLIGRDAVGLDRLMVQARHNDVLHGITGLLWTDGVRFAQVVEGGSDALDGLWERLQLDPRHRAVSLVSRHTIAKHAFGEWSMARPDEIAGGLFYERRILGRLDKMPGPISTTFRRVVIDSRASHAV